MASAAAHAPSLALLGAGAWGCNLARCFHALGALELVVDEHDADALGRLAQRLPGLRTSRSVQSALEDPRITAVAIATPSGSHFELARAALRAKKHVFVEKPLCLRVEHGKALVELAASVERTLMVGHLLQYHPCIVELRRLVAGGALGRLLTINSSRLNLGKFRRDESALWSFAPHDVSVILSLLGDELPQALRCSGDAFIDPGVVDATLTTMRFASGVSAQIHVSWLNPFKEQKLTLVGTQAMAVFDDTKPWSQKLMLYRDYLGSPDQAGPQARGEAVVAQEAEPLLCECSHFLEACRGGLRPRSDGQEGVRVLSVLEMAQRSLELDGELVRAAPPEPRKTSYFVHPSALVAADAVIGEGTKIWHFTQVMSGARVGPRCSLGQNVNVAGGAVLGSGVRVQNNVSIYSGVEVEDDVFLGPACAFSNVKYPRAELDRSGSYERTLLRRGCTVGANATVVCGVTLGRYSFIAAGAVVTRDVPDYALMLGNPARQRGWVGRHGRPLQPAADGVLVCPESQLRYREVEAGQLRCLDLDEAAPLPDRRP